MTNKHYQCYYLKKLRLTLKKQQLEIIKIKLHSLFLKIKNLIIKPSIVSPLHLAIEKRLKTRYNFELLDEENIKSTFLNLATDINVNLINKQGNNPLQYAILSYDNLAINILIKSPTININHCNKQNLNALMLASTHHLFLYPTIKKEKAIMLAQLIERTDFNAFYKNNNTHYIFKIIDQLLYQLEEKEQPVSYLIDLFLSKLNYKIEEDKVYFPLLKRPYDKNYYFVPIKILDLMKIYQEKLELEKLSNINIPNCDIINDIAILKKQQKI